MCGIAGIAGKSALDREQVARRLNAMLPLIQHRGPDGEGAFFAPHLAMGMRRLAIIDLAGGQQPMFNERRSVAVTFNGEIYNYLELRAAYLAKGHKFATRSDTEVIPHAYDEEGLDFPKRLRGMFGIALHDAELRRLVLVRDRLGIKPLYYYWSGQELIFGSEMRSVLAALDQQPEINLDAVQEYLVRGYVAAPATFYKGLSRLQPGHMLVFDGTEPRLHCYWELPRSAPAFHPLDEWLDEVERLIAESVRLHLISDVPLGVFLSGGIDSGCLAHYISQHNPEKVFSFTTGVDGSPLDERPMAQKIAAHAGTKHRTFTMRSDLFAKLPEVIWHREEPTSDSNAIALYEMAALARSEVKVVLSGDGADELFGGYVRYQLLLLRKIIQAVPPSARNALRLLLGQLSPSAARLVEGHDEAHWYFRWMSYFQDEEARALWRADLRPGLAEVSPHTEDFSRRQLLSAASRHDLQHYVGSNLMEKGDKMLMGHSVEGRFPYLDHVLVEHVQSLPGRFRLSARETKILLRRIARKWLPAEAARARKRGFTMPIKAWITGELRPQVEQFIMDKDSFASNYFQCGGVDAVLGRPEAASRLWIMWCLEVWFMLYRKGVLWRGKDKLADAVPDAVRRVAPGEMG